MIPPAKAAASALAMLAMLAMLAAPPVAAAGDAETGGDIARRWCGSCHVIEARQTGAVADSAPAFRTLADDPAKSPGYLRAFLTDPHYPMPKIALSRAEIGHLIAYIESLRGR